jgi:spermidine synthase
MANMVRVERSRGVGHRVWAGERARPVVTVEDGRTLLRVDGVIQSVAVNERYVPDIWDAMLPIRRPTSALILGQGGGTTATLLTEHYGPIPILGVERDARIAELARERFGLEHHPNIQTVVADAFEFVATCQARADLICVDLYVAGHMQHGVLGADFLRQVSRILRPEGTVTFNIWASRFLPDQLRRLQRVLAVEDIVEVGRNVVVRCTHRPLVTVLPR